jgi:hypothetical protein
MLVGPITDNPDDAVQYQCTDTPLTPDGAPQDSSWYIIPLLFTRAS